MEKIYSKIVVGESHYFVGKKYCRRCEYYFITKNIFCQCCGMQLRGTPTERELKEKIRDNSRKKPITVVL
jgi:rRNA maturation endonuclease Nob1